MIIRRLLETEGQESDGKNLVAQRFEGIVHLTLPEHRDQASRSRAFLRRASKAEPNLPRCTRNRAATPFSNEGGVFGAAKDRRLHDCVLGIIRAPWRIPFSSLGPLNC
jgi:hypothetical protein